MNKKISPEIKSKIISLSGKCFWYWASFYNFYATILNISSRELENKIPKENTNKYKVTEKILEQSDISKIKEIISEFYKLSHPFDRNDNPKYKEAVEELKEYKQLVGKDIIREEVDKKEFDRKIENSKKINELERIKSQKIGKIKEEFSYFSTSEDRQKAGFFLEEAFFKILDLEQIEFVKSYRTSTEQIDGHFKFKGWDYLVEIKWTKDSIKQRDISIFDGKIKTKAQSTRGLILSISGFDDSAINIASIESPRIIFLDVQHFILILDERLEFKDILKTSIDNLVRFGKVYNKQD